MKQALHHLNKPVLNNISSSVGCGNKEDFSSVVKTLINVN